MDLLIHVSVQDLQRNLRSYISRKSSPLDTFVPGWRQEVDVERSDAEVRGRLFESWRDLLTGLGMNTAEAAERIDGPTGQPLYWLALVAPYSRALDFWEKIRDYRNRGRSGKLL